jgi:hypothetical protein
MLVDCRQVPDVSTDMFPDGLHMNQEASVLYSRFLAGQMTPQLASMAQLRRPRLAAASN